MNRDVFRRSTVSIRISFQQKQNFLIETIDDSFWDREKRIFTEFNRRENRLRVTDRSISPRMIISNNSTRIFTVIQFFSRSNDFEFIVVSKSICLSRWKNELNVPGRIRVSFRAAKSWIYEILFCNASQKNREELSLEKNLQIDVKGIQFVAHYQEMFFHIWKFGENLLFFVSLTRKRSKLVLSIKNSKTAEKKQRKNVLLRLLFMGSSNDEGR